MNDFNERPNVNRAPGSVIETPPAAAPVPVRTRQVTREKRRPFGSHIQKLAYEAREGYHRHWFNDLPGRIDQALEAGYTHVEDKEGKKVCRVVGVSAAGGSLTGYLMETPEEWYKEDMAEQAKANAEREQAIRSGSVAGQPGKDGVYIPASRGIKITTSK